VLFLEGLSLGIECWCPACLALPEWVCMLLWYACFCPIPIITCTVFLSFYDPFFFLGGVFCVSGHICWVHLLKGSYGMVVITISFGTKGKHLIHGLTHLVCHAKSLFSCPVSFTLIPPLFLLFFYWLIHWNLVYVLFPQTFSVSHTRPISPSSILSPHSLSFCPSHRSYLPFPLLCFGVTSHFSWSFHPLMHCSFS